MIELFKDSLMLAVQGDWLDKMTFVLLSIGSLGFVVMILYWLFRLLDYSLSTSGHRAVGTLVDKDYEGESTSIVMINNVQVPSHHPACWNLYLRVNDQVVAFPV